MAIILLALIIFDSDDIFEPFAQAIYCPFIHFVSGMGLMGLVDRPHQDELTPRSIAVFYFPASFMDKANHIIPLNAGFRRRPQYIREGFLMFRT